jgi:hypothetical protein
MSQWQQTLNRLIDTFLLTKFHYLDDLFSFYNATDLLFKKLEFFRAEKL